MICGVCVRRFFFFFQAEDGIRDDLVTGVQTCALPIFIGVAPEDFAGPEAFVNPDIYIPMHAYQHAVPGASADYLTSRKNRSAVLLGRLAPGASVAAAQSELRTIARGLAAQYPESNRDRTVTVLDYLHA